MDKVARATLTGPAFSTQSTEFVLPRSISRWSLIVAPRATVGGTMTLRVYHWRDGAFVLKTTYNGLQLERVSVLSFVSAAPSRIRVEIQFFLQPPEVLVELAVLRDEGGRLRSRGVPFDAVWTIGAERTTEEPYNTRDITCQLYDRFGDKVSGVRCVPVLVYSGSTQQLQGNQQYLDSLPTGRLVRVESPDESSTVRGRVHHVLTDEDGLVSLRWTDAASLNVRLGVRLPSGEVILSASFTNNGIDDPNMGGGGAGF